MLRHHVTMLSSPYEESHCEAALSHMYGEYVMVIVTLRGSNNVLKTYNYSCLIRSSHCDIRTLVMHGMVCHSFSLQNQFRLITVLYLVMLVFQINLTSALMTSFLLFSQLAIYSVVGLDASTRTTMEPVSLTGYIGYSYTWLLCTCFCFFDTSYLLLCIYLHFYVAVIWDSWGMYRHTIPCSRFQSHTRLSRSTLVKAVPTHALEARCVNVSFSLNGCLILRNP